MQLHPVELLTPGEQAVRCRCCCRLECVHDGL